MEENRPPLEELPETRHTRLDRIGSMFKRRQKAPELPPPLLVEQLAALAEVGTVEAEPAEEVEVTLESVPDLEPDAARQELEKVYEATEATATESEPTELEYEKRAEIKHEPEPTEDERNLADAVSRILDELKEKTAAAHAAFSRMAPKPAGINLPNVPMPAIFVTLPALYKKAVLLGFGSAVVTLVMIVVLK